MNYGTHCNDLVQKKESKMLTEKQPYKMSAKMMSGNNNYKNVHKYKMYLL